MNKESHIQIGKILYERLRSNHGIYLDQGAFLLGNILPDIGIKFLIKPHLLRNYRVQLKKRIKNILHMRKPTAIMGKSCASQLGIICHYYADFFCHVHNGGYSGDVAAHVKYEKELCRYLMAMRDELNEMPPVHIPFDEIDVDTVFDRFLSAHAAYLLERPSYQNDIKAGIQACLEVLVLIITAMTDSQASEYSAAIVMKA